MLSMSTVFLASVLFYFLGTPLLVYFTYTIQARPKVHVFDPSKGMPEAVRENFDRRFHEFNQLGFRHLGTFTLPNAVKNFKSVFALYESEEHQIMAGTTASFLKVVGVWNLRGQSVTMGTMFTDGCEVETTNLSELYDFPVASGSVRTQHPELQRTQDVFDAHLAMVRHYRNGRSSELTLHSKYESDVKQYFTASLFEEFSKAAQVGRLSLKEVALDAVAQAESEDAVESDPDWNPFQSPSRNESNDKNSIFVPTLKGAYIATMSSLWPIKPILRRIRFARDRKMLAETGHRWS